MNLEVAKRQYEVRMLITSDGFMVKVKKHGKPNRFNCFFMDDTFNHRPWILSVKRGLIPALGEYNRLKGS